MRKKKSEKLDSSKEDERETDGTAPIKRGRGRPKLTEPSVKFELRKQQILLAFHQAFSEKGYHPISIQEVADANDIPKANIYYYFPSKAHIFYALMEQRLVGSIADMETILTIEDPKDLIKLILRRHVNIAASRDRIMETYSWSRPPVEKEITDRITKKHKIYIDYMTEAIRRGMAAGIIPKANPDVLSVAIFGMPYNIRSIVKYDDSSKEDVLNSIYALIGFQDYPEPNKSS